MEHAQMAAKRASLITYFDVLQGAVKMMSDFLGSRDWDYFSTVYFENGTKISFLSPKLLLNDQNWNKNQSQSVGIPKLNNSW